MIRRFFQRRQATLPFLLCMMVLFAFVLLNSTPSIAEEEEWRFVNLAGGISVHRRSKDNSRFIEFKARGDLQGEITKYVNILLDTDKMPDWAPQCIEAKNIEKISQSEDIVYVACNGVWPVADRDYVAKRTIISDIKKTYVRINVDLTDHHNVPANDKRVHIPHLQCCWILRKIDHSHTYVELHAFVDPGGRLPAWLVNWGYRRIPHKYLVGLESMVAKHMYSAKELVPASLQ